jgi:hypothetical protein
MRYNTVYVRKDHGGFEFGLDRVTPVTWYFSPRRSVPKLAYVGYSIETVDQDKLAAIPKPFIGSYYELREALGYTTRED